MFVGTEPEVMTETLQGFTQVEEMGSVTWTEESGPMPEVSLDQLQEKPTTSFTFVDTSEAATRGPAYVNPRYTMYMDSQDIETKPETDDGTRPEPPAEKTLTFQELAEKIIESVDGKFPTEAVEQFMSPAGEKEYKHPFDPINDLHYQLNNAIQPLVDSMQKIIRDPYKASEVMSTTHFNYMVKEYGYLHSFLELSHKLIKERLRERDSKRG